MKNSILNYNLEQLVTFLKSINEPTFRANQIHEAIYVQNKTSFNDFTTLSKNTRQVLDDNFLLRTLTKIDETTSGKDKTKKYLWKLQDGYKIESVVIYQKDRVTFCISSQVGCALDCKFCATGKMGILRNLNVGEIVEHVLQMQQLTDQKLVLH